MYLMKEIEIMNSILLEMRTCLQVSIYTLQYEKYLCVE
jgi:hypothetical protein